MKKGYFESYYNGHVEMELDLKEFRRYLQAIQYEEPRWIHKIEMVNEMEDELYIHLRVRREVNEEAKRTGNFCYLKLKSNGYYECFGPYGTVCNALSCVRSLALLA